MRKQGLVQPQGRFLPAHIPALRRHAGDRETLLQGQQETEGRQKEQVRLLHSTR